MAELKDLKLGTSMCFMGAISPEKFKELSDNGIDCIEYSYGYNYYMNDAEYPVHAVKYANMARKYGVEPWSIHLPFSRRLDITNENAELRSITLATNKMLIRAAGRAGVKVAVLHPSSEPIEDERRPERMKWSREGIKILQAECEKAGMMLAVEDLPRTCLCRTSDEMIELVRDTGAGVVFDTNHCLVEDNVHYVNALTKAGIKIISLHISDYFRIDGVLDERHVLPGEGINDWKKLMAAIMKNGYDGPLMYEVPRHPKYNAEPYTTEQLADNMKKLRAGKI
ncbi:MAG: sugar phosphate isomerase/epimerase [Clostridia bacterium]|nr:sugar phosphate isomerase/epimerase [Clostridia bacterium]